MKSFLAICIFLVCTPILKAQDIFVRITGDTVHAEIVHENDRFIYYRNSDTKRGELDVISRLEVASILYNYEAPDLSFQNTNSTPKKKRDFNSFEAWIVFGLYLLPIDYSGSPDFDDYYKNLGRGSGFTAGAQYFVSEYIGFGGRYSRTNFSNSFGKVQNIVTGQIGNLKDNITIQYLGIGISTRLPIPKYVSYFEIEIGIGYTDYHNEAELIEPYTLSGTGLGGHLSMGFNLSLGNDLFIPIKGGISGFQVKHIDVEIANKTSRIGKQIQRDAEAAASLKVTRLSLSAGILFQF